MLQEQRVDFETARGGRESAVITEIRCALRGGYMVVVLRGLWECIKGYGIKGCSKYCEIIKGTATRVLRVQDNITLMPFL